MYNLKLFFCSRGKMPNFEQLKTDVLVVGGGNAALCAAMTARAAGVKVLLLESTPKHFRGGNSRHTRNIRYLHDRANEFLRGAYHGDEF
jgi:tricarballylate dehydrogenase